VLDPMTMLPFAYAGASKVPVSEIVLTGWPLELKT
jgi:hypothetical protein